MKSLSWRPRLPELRLPELRLPELRLPDRKREESAAPLVVASPPPRALPSPALRWVGQGGRIALRAFDWGSDADAICQWQTETYALNFPEFQFTDSFHSAFRHDLRRAILDDNHGIFVLDEGPSGGKSCGFIWLVLCQNSWTSERYGYVNNLYIAPEKRGQELAGALLDFSTDWFKKRRVSRLRLTVTASNAAACRLYEKNGYRTTRLEMEKEI